MRDDLEVLRRALQARKAGSLSNVELAEARQACNDCNGWLQRLARSASRGRDGEGVNSVSAVACAIGVRAVAREGILASIPAGPVPRKV